MQRKRKAKDLKNKIKLVKSNGMQEMKYKNKIKNIKTQKKHKIINLNCKTKKAKESKETK